jgi:hypothetical protein
MKAAADRTGRLFVSGGAAGYAHRRTDGTRLDRGTRFDPLFDFVIDPGDDIGANATACREIASALVAINRWVREAGSFYDLTAA